MLFRKKREEVTEIKEVVEKKLPPFKIVHEWDADRAGYKYTLYRMEPLFSSFRVDFVYKTAASSPDLKWAEANAEHYGIQIEEEQEQQ